MDTFPLILRHLLFCKLFFCDDILENIAGIDFLSSSVPAAKQKIIIQSQYPKSVLSYCYQLISEHFGVNRVIL